MNDNILHVYLRYQLFLSLICCISVFVFYLETGKIGIIEVLYFCTFCNIAILSSNFQMVCTKHFLSEWQVLILLRVAIYTVLSGSYNLCFKGSSPHHFACFSKCVLCG